MHTFGFPFLVILGVVLLIVGFVTLRMRPAKSSPVALLAAISPGLLMLLLFYSMVIDMHQSLRGWPTSVGDHGFPPSLIIHNAIAGGFFFILLLVTYFMWPVAFLLCLAIRRWRACVYYLGVFGLVATACFATTSLAPARFLDWFWD